MRAALATFSLSRFSFLSLNSLTRLIAPLRRASARPAAPAAASASAARREPAAAAPRMDAATYAAMLAEAERIAAPYRGHIAAQMAALAPAEAPDSGDDFGEVEALLTRAGLLSD